MENLSNHLLPNGKKIYCLNDEARNEIAEEDSTNILQQEVDENLSKELETQEVITDLKIRTPDLEGNKRWQFIYCGDTITPFYSEAITEQLKSITNQRLKDCYINVNLIIKYAKINSSNKKQSNKYEIKSINKIFYKENNQTKPC